MRSLKSIAGGGLAPRQVHSLLLALVALGLLLFPQAVRAQNVTVQLIKAEQPVKRGGSVNFYGAVRNNAGTTQFINGYTFSLIDPSQTYLIPDGNLFPAPQTLGGRGTSASAPLFIIKVKPSTPVGTYSGFFNVQGGPLPSSTLPLGTVKFTVDVFAGTPPVGTASLSGPQGTNGWYTGPVTVTLSYAPSDADVVGTFYMIDGGPQQTYTGPFTVSNDLIHTVDFFSHDTPGNMVAKGQVTVKVDGTPPVVTFGAPTPAPNASGFNNTAVSLPYTGTDATSGIAGLSPVSPLSFTTEGTGLTQTVLATDVAGNTKSFPSPAVINIDLTAPKTTATLSGTQGVGGAYTGPVTVTLAATDALSGVAGTGYILDNAPVQGYAAPFTVSGDGTHTVVFSSTDKAGNAEAATTLTITIDSTKQPLATDTTPPVTQAVVTGTQNPDGSFAGSATVTLTATDDKSGVASTVYQVDSAPQQPYSQPFNVSTVGSHTVTFHSVDAAGNVEAAQTVTFVVAAVVIPNPVPTLTGLGTSSVPANGPGFLLTVNGTNFVSSAKVNFNGTVLATSFVNAGQLIAQVPASAITATRPRAVSVTVTNPAPGGGTSNALPFSITVAIAHAFPAGLQLFSVPADYSGVPLGSALDAASPKLAVWQPQLLTYVLTPSAPADALRPGQGYWARFAQTVNLYDLGTPTPTTAPFGIGLRAGWNMIGDPFPTSVTASRLVVQDASGKFYPLADANAAGLVYTTLYAYPAGSTVYQSISGANGTLFPYMGYWFYAFTDCTLFVKPQ